MQLLFTSRGQNFTFITSTINNSSSITIPSTANSGDFAVLFDFAGDSDFFGISSASPNGWTRILNNDYTDLDNSLRTIISYKILSSSDPNSNITGMNDGYELKTLLIFRPDFEINEVSYVEDGNITSGNPPSQSLNMAGILPAVIAISHSVSQGAVAPSFTSSVTMNQIDNILTSNVRQFVKYLAYNTNSTISPSNITVDMSDGGVNILQSAYFTFT
jgi:hypothetical protein